MQFSVSFQARVKSLNHYILFYRVL